MEAAMSKAQSPTAKLSDAQLVILSAAAQRTDGSLLPFPRNLTVKGAALNKIVDTLCKRKLAEERRAIKGTPEWRRDEDNQPLGLFITNGGLLALGVDDAEKERPSQAAASMSRQRKTEAAASTQSFEAITCRLKAACGAFAKQTGRRDPDASAAIRRQDRGDHRRDRLAAAFGAGVFQRPREKEAKASPRLRRRSGNGVRRYHIAQITSAKA
jgi:hypothetical protein